MTDGFVRVDDSRFNALTEAERSNESTSAVDSTDEDSPILHPVAESPRRVRLPRLGIASKVWNYMADTESVAFKVCRFDKPNGKKEIRPYSPWRGADGSVYWRWTFPPGPRPLYKLPDVVARTDAPVMICEGEPATDAAALIFPDHVTTCWPSGASAVRLTDFGPLAGRHVTLWPDNDEPGRAAASELIAILFRLGCRVDVIDAEKLSATVPDHSDEKREPILKWDAADAAADGADLELLRLVIERHTTTAKAPPAYWSFGRFTMNATGLYAPSRRSKEADPPTLVSGPFEIIGRTRSPIGRGWGRLVRWHDGDGRSHTHLILDADLQGNPALISSQLASDGLMI